MNLELAHGADPGYVNSLPAKISLLLGGGLLSNTVRRLATHLLSPIVAAPSISSTEVWSVKNTALVAQQFMLAATAYGLATAPMEGFDERRLCYQLKIPTCDYCVPMVVCVGYSIKEDSAQISKESENRCAMQKVRFPLEDVAYSNSFGKKLELN